MRYPVILFLLLLLAVVAIPLKERDSDKRAPVMDHVLSPQQQQEGQRWLDSRVNDLRAMPPVHQVLAMTTLTILVVCGAILLSYIVNSVAMILGLGVSMLLLLPLLLLAMLGIGKARRALKTHLSKHPEFGPLYSRVNTRLWKRRFKRAAREHGFVREY